MYINKIGYSPVSFKKSFYSEDFKTQYSYDCFTSEDSKKLDEMVDSFEKLSEDKNQNIKIELDYDDRELGIGFIFGRIWDKGTKYDISTCKSCGTVFELKYDGIDKAIRDFKGKVNSELNKISSKES